MNMRALPIATGLLPIVAIHACYLLAIEYASLPACIPYFDGCTSISATGRYPPASYLFKAVMLPETVLLGLYWVLNVSWLRTVEVSLGLQPRRYVALGALGIGGALCLIIYVTFLGSAEPFYEFMRRFGVYLYFLFSVLAQLVLALRSGSLAVQLANRALQRISRLQLLLSVAPFVLGITNLVLKATLDDSDRAENIIEWIFALMMQCFFLLSYFAWRSSGFRANFSVRPDAG